MTRVTAPYLVGPVVMRICILLCLLAGSDIQAQYRTDSLRILEEQDLLELFGAFPVIPGDVHIDEIPQRILHWSSSKIVCSIPDTGKGSAGPVVISSLTHKTEPRNITLWEGDWSRGRDEHHSRPSGSARGLRFRMRGDLHTALVKRNAVMVLTLRPQSRLYVNDYWGSQWTPEYGYETQLRTWANLPLTYDTAYKRGFKAKAHVYVRERRIRFDIYGVNGVSYSASGSCESTHSEGSLDPFYFYLAMDSMYSVDSVYIVEVGEWGVYTDTHRENAHVSFLPPTQLLVLRYAPLLDTVTEVVSTGHMRLIWHTYAGVSQYHVQVSQHPGFAQPVRDFLENDTSAIVLLPRDTTYYWRVRGLNQYGMTAWSHTGTFIRPTAMAVDEELQPSRAWLHRDRVKYRTTGEALGVHVYDILGRIVDQFEISGEGERQLELQTRPLFLLVSGQTKPLILR
jgi:hypothetical protein